MFKYCDPAEPTTVTVGVPPPQGDAGNAPVSPVQTGPGTAVFIAVALPLQIATAGRSEAMVDLKAVAFALPRAPFNETNTTDDKIPIIAITTSNSIRVKPLEKFFFIE
jgi:hypothetical protein